MQRLSHWLWSQRHQHQRRRGVHLPREAAGSSREHGADLGIAHDGDSDRCRQAVDEKGNLVDGDQIMAILAVAAKREGKSAKDTPRNRNEQPGPGAVPARVHPRPTAVDDRCPRVYAGEHGYNLRTSPATSS